MAVNAINKSAPTARSLLDRSSIATRLVIFAVGLVGVTATSIGALSYTRARRALETDARTGLVLLARDVAAHVHEELENRAADITHWSRLEVMRALIYQDVDKELAKFLEQTLHERAAYRAIVALDATGRSVAGAGAVEEIEPDGAGDTVRVSIVPRTDRATARFEAPIFNPERPTAKIGTLVVLLDLSPMLEAVDPSLRGTTSAAALTLRERGGRIVAESRGHAERAAGSTDGMLTAVAPVERVHVDDAPHLEVVVSEPHDVAFAGVASLRSALLKTGVLVAALGAVLAAWVAWRIGRPIRQLTTTVHEVAERGEPLPQSAFPETGGEVGVLASAFRTMMESLSAAQREALAQSRLAFLGEIAANIAHEVRTPLSVLKTAAQLLARGGMPPAEQRDLALTAAGEVDRLNAVVTSLVDLARPKPVHHRPEAVDPIVDRAVAFFQPLAAKAGVDLVRAGARDGSTVHASADQLYQVLLNLLQNAMQAVRHDGTVTVVRGRDDGWVVIAVEDTGPGFAADVLPRVFSPFVTTKADGTGLGLAIVKRMVEEHGGTVGAENRPAGGARVWVRLPAREDAT
jgi:signal transduction histidine kinase